MKLRAFELCASHFDKENGAFGSEVRHLLIHFLEYYKMLDTANVKKVFVEFQPEGADFYSHSPFPIADYENALDIACLKYTFDFDKYWSLSGIDKLEFVLAEFVKALKIVCEKEGIDSTHFDEVAQKIKEDGYVFQGYWKKRAIANPSKTRTANIFFKCLMHKVEIYAEIKEGKAEPQMTLIDEIIPPYVHLFKNAFGKVYWEADDVLTFEHKDGELLTLEL